MKKKGGRKIKKSNKTDDVILKEAEENIMKLYTNIINLDEKNEIIPYKTYKISEYSTKFNKIMDTMIKVYLNKISDNKNNIYNNNIEYNFKKEIKKIISFFNMNENEFSFFTLLLELINFKEAKDLYYIGILCIQLSSDNYQNKNNEDYNKWKENIYRIYADKIQLINDIKVINDRCEELLIIDEFNPN